jgi:hypothetical protein
METAEARWLITRGTDKYQQEIEKHVPRCDKCLIEVGNMWKNSGIGE